MTQQAELLARYKHFRQIGLGLNSQLVKTLTKADIEEGARQLGMMRKGVLVLDTEDVSSVLMDFCLHDVRRQGQNAIDRFLAKSPPPANSDEMIFLRGKQTSWFAVFIVESVSRGVGVQVRDLLRDVFLDIVDVGLSQSAAVGFVMASRLMTADGINMTTGAALPVGTASTATKEQLVESLKMEFPGVDFRQMSSEQSSKLAATFIRSCLKRGAAENIQYRDAGNLERKPSTSHSQDPVQVVGRNDPCPCGSGKKFKRCCGSRA
jgi:uncharacterized protein YchJ